MVQRWLALILAIILIVIAVTLVSGSWYGWFLTDPSFELVNNVAFVVLIVLSGIAAPLIVFAFKRTSPTPIRFSSNTPQLIRNATITLYSSTDVKERENALAMLASAETDEAVKLWQQILNHPLVDVQIHAAIELAKLTKYQSKAAYHRLAKVLLNKTESKFITRTTEVLAEYADPQIADLMLNLFLGTNVEDNRHKHAYRYMINLGVPAISYLLEAKRKIEATEDFNVHDHKHYKHILHILGKIGGGEAIQSLIETLNTFRYYGEAIQHLKEIGTPLFESVMIEFMDKSIQQFEKALRDKVDMRINSNIGIPVTEVRLRKLHQCRITSHTLREIGTPKALAAAELWQVYEDRE